MAKQKGQRAEKRHLVRWNGTCSSFIPFSFGFSFSVLRPFTPGVVQHLPPAPAPTHLTIDCCTVRGRPLILEILLHEALPSPRSPVISFCASRTSPDFSASLSQHLPRAKRIILSKTLPSQLHNTTMLLPFLTLSHFVFCDCLLTWLQMQWTRSCSWPYNINATA